MKTIFYNILFVSVLCCGFSVYAQDHDSVYVQDNDNDNDDEWHTCLDEEGRCFEIRTNKIFSVDYLNTNIKVSYYANNGGKFYVLCSYTRYYAGRKCFEIKKKENQNK